MKKQQKQKYVPTIKVPSDDLVVKDGEGNEHRPHEGEHVVFRKGVPMSVMRVANRAAKANTDNPAEAMDLIEALIGVLAHQVVDWNWTDLDYELLPSPKNDPDGFAESLWRLEDYEIAWLQEHMMDGANLGKN